MIATLLKLVPLRDWLYVAVIVALSIFGAVEWHKHNTHEQALGAAKVVAADTKVADAAKTQIAAGTATATTTETSNAKTYEATVTAPVRGVGVLCRRAGVTPPGSVVPQAGAVAAPGAGVQPADGGSGPAFDPSGDLLQRAHAADAQIAYLQARIRELEQQMVNSP